MKNMQKDDKLAENCNLYSEKYVFIFNRLSHQDHLESQNTVQAKVFGALGSKNFKLLWVI